MATFCLPSLLSLRSPLVEAETSALQGILHCRQLRAHSAPWWTETQDGPDREVRDEADEAGQDPVDLEKALEEQRLRRPRALVGERKV